MACSFCDKLHNGDKLIDHKNDLNIFYITCVENHLRLWEGGGYRGCYEINYCPICGRNLKTNEEG